MSVKRPTKAVFALRGKFSAKTPTIKVKRFKTPPLLDGNADDSCWHNAEEFSLSDWNKKEKVEPTKCKIGHDGKNLYIYMEMTHNKPLKKTNIYKHDGPVYAYSDSCEVFLLGEKDNGYGHFAFDHVGNLFDETVVQSLGKDWNSEWFVNIQKTKNIWSAEVKIPFKSMIPVVEVPVSKGTVWRANFIRSYSTAKQYSCWSPTFGNKFKTIDFFGKLIFE